MIDKTNSLSDSKDFLKFLDEFYTDKYKPEISAWKFSKTENNRLINKRVDAKDFQNIDNFNQDKFVIKIDFKK